MPTIPVRDTTLHFEQTGTGPQLLFIHGLAGHAGVWAGQVQRLADQFTCITYDRRGHTRSAAGTEPESVPTHAADAAALIEALGLTRPLVVGSSAGARIAVELARTRPDLLVGAVLSEPPIFSLEPAAGDAFRADFRAAVGPAAKAGGPRAVIDALLALLGPGTMSTLDEADMDRYRANGGMVLAESTAPPYQLSLDQVAGIHVPALVIAGTTSHPGLQTIAATLARTLPTARLLPLTGSGHMTFADRPDEFAAAVRDFARQLGVLSDPPIVPIGVPGAM